ncbi:class I SAM-dependent methyltransferase [Acinetobacter portensis]|uniref:class I SAM-dependent methyltransferase n=1 Tax=Acinetobacter portensis TaxID=1839785 RepID=UPI0013D6597D|nr:class I SAM-dependent methyltransferase [Acinetobacter portensis]
MLFYRCTKDKESQNMTQSLHSSAQKGFSSAAELYQQVRPSYPQSIALWLQDRLQLSSETMLLDLGSGTGKFLPYLQQITQHITAVEPIDEMLAQLKQAYPNVQTLQAFSNNMPIQHQTVDVVTCAQSFHWFAHLETLTEIHRILKPNGYLVLIWNQRDIGINWVKALADVISPFEGNTPRYHSNQWRKVFQEQDLFKLYQETTIPHLHHGTVEQVVSKRLLSTSFIAAMPKSKQLELKAQFERIVQEYTGKSLDEEIDFPYITHVYVFEKITTE